jgi:hypothetical protein
VRVKEPIRSERGERCVKRRHGACVCLQLVIEGAERDLFSVAWTLTGLNDAECSFSYWCWSPFFCSFRFCYKKEGVGEKRRGVGTRKRGLGMARGMRRERKGRDDERRLSTKEGVKDDRVVSMGLVVKMGSID